MQNHKFKKTTTMLACAMALSFVCGSLQAQDKKMGAQQTSPASTMNVQMAPQGQSSGGGAPAVQSQSTPSEPSLLQLGGSDSGRSRLSELDDLKFEQARLNLKRDIAKLKSEIEKEESGGKGGPGQAGNMGAAQAAMMQQLSMQAAIPAQQQEILYNSMTLSSVYGSGAALTAELLSTKGKHVGKAGLMLPTGETVSVIKADHVILTHGKKTRRLNPSSEDTVSAAKAQLAELSKMAQQPMPAISGQQAVPGSVAWPELRPPNADVIPMPSNMMPPKQGS
jgi:type IV pilus biogenesis protein PilP